MYKIPFSGRAHTYTEDEKKIIMEAVEGALPLTQGKYQNEFQEKFAS